MESTLADRDDNKPWFHFLLELALLFVFAFAYCYGITKLAQISYNYEAILVLIIPAIIFYLVKDKTFSNTRIMQLLVIETVFLVLVLIAKISINMNLISLNKLMNIAILGFFLGQTLLFLIYQYKIKSYLGFIRSIFLCMLIIHWFWINEAISYIDSEGRFLFFNSNAPKLLILYYCVSVISVPLVDSTTLPNFRQSSLHFASVAVAVLSGEFFHSRILTACHFFALDLLFRYTEQRVPSFGVISTDQLLVYNAYPRKFIDVSTFIICLIIFVGYFAA